MNSDQLLAALPQAGVEVLDALERFMGNELLYLSFLRRLPQAMDLSGIRQALREARHDLETPLYHLTAAAYRLLKI